jgi:PAS domain S-box-containing protein
MFNDDPPIPTSHEGLLHEVFDQSSAGFQVIDRDWKYLFVNSAVAKQGRTKVEDLVGRTMMQKYPGIEKTKLFEYLKKSMDDKVVVRMENEFIFPDGSKGWFQLFVHPWSEGIMIFSVDITGRKLAEAELHQKIEDLEKRISSPGEKSKLTELQKALAKLREPEILVV